MNRIEKIFKISKLFLCGVFSNKINPKTSRLFFWILNDLNIIGKKVIGKIESLDIFLNIFFEIFPKMNIFTNSTKKIVNFYKNGIPIKVSYFEKNKNSGEKKQLIKNENRKLRFVDFAGIENFLPEIQKFIICPIVNFRLYRDKNLKASNGILLSGPSGSGKTLLVHVIAGELNLPIFYLSLYKINNSVSGIDGKKIQNLFNLASKNSPSIILIEELDTIASNAEHYSNVYEKKLLQQLILCIDKIKKNTEICVMIFATARSSEQIDGVVRRPGRIDNEIKFNIPCFSTRLKLIENMSSKFSFDDDFKPNSLALTTKGYVSGDLFHLLSLAASFTVFRLSYTLISSNYRKKIPLQNLDIMINIQDLDKAKILIDSGLIKNGFNMIPEVQWSEIGALDQVKRVLSKYIVEPIKFPYKKLDAHDNGFGILLYGPPGCGKTLLVSAIVRESGANFIFVKGPEILNKFLGESEKGIRNIFSRAKLFNPTIIFFDEFDSVAAKRELVQGSNNSSSSDRVVNQLLTEIDSIEKKKKNLFYRSN